MRRRVGGSGGGGSGGGGGGGGGGATRPVRTWTGTPAARRAAMPPLLTSGFGSTMATTTRATRASMSAWQHGGVRPWWLQGSRVT